MRCAAVEALAQLVRKDDQHAVTAVAPRLENDECHVRRAAVQGLAQLVEKGDQHAIIAVAVHRIWMKSLM